MVAGVRIFCFKSEFRRIFLVAAIDPRDVALVRGTVGTFVGGIWEGEQFAPARPRTANGAPPALHGTVAPSGVVALGLIDFFHGVHDLGARVKDVRYGAAQFSGRAVIGAGRILDIGVRRGGKTGNQEGAEQFFHRVTLHIIAIAAERQRHFFGYLTAAGGWQAAEK